MRKTGILIDKIIKKSIFYIFFILYFVMMICNKEIVKYTHEEH